MNAKVHSNHTGHHLTNADGEVVHSFKKDREGLKSARQAMYKDYKGLNMKTPETEPETQEESIEKIDHARDYVLRNAPKRMGGMHPISKKAFLNDLEKTYPGIIKDLGEGAFMEAHDMKTDHEVSMARKDVSRLAKYSSELEKMLSNVSEEEGLQGWVQAKITKAADYISSVKHYMEGDVEVNEHVRYSPEQGFGGQERNFIHDLSMMYDGVKRDPAGLKYLGTSEMWDEGNILKDKGKLTTLMLWVKKNKDVVEKRFSRMFGTYSNKDENGKVTASDGNQILNNIIKKIGKINKQPLKEDGRTHTLEVDEQTYIEAEHHNVVVSSNDMGIIVDIYDKKSANIDTTTYWNDDVMESKNIKHDNKKHYEDKKMSDLENKLKEQLEEGITVNTTSTNDDNVEDSMTVTAQGEDAMELMNMLKMAGIGQSEASIEVPAEETPCAPTNDIDDMANMIKIIPLDDIEEVEEEVELANAPDEKYADTDTLVNKISGGMNRRKRAFKKAEDGDNPMAVSESADELTARLIKEYDEFKITAPEDSEEGDWEIEKIGDWSVKVGKSHDNEDEMPFDTELAGALADEEMAMADAPEHKIVCKDCGDELHKPTTDCHHDCHDEDGDWWVTEELDLPETGDATTSDASPETEQVVEDEVDEGAKPDFLDLDKDGDKEESMKKAAKDKKEKAVTEERIDEFHGLVDKTVSAMRKPFMKKKDINSMSTQDMIDNNVAVRPKKVYPVDDIIDNPTPLVRSERRSERNSARTPK